MSVFVSLCLCFFYAGHVVWNKTDDDDNDDDDDDDIIRG